MFFLALINGLLAPAEAASVESLIEQGDLKKAEQVCVRKSDWERISCQNAIVGHFISSGKCKESAEVEVRLSDPGNDFRKVTAYARAARCEIENANHAAASAFYESAVELWREQKPYFAYAH